jgi:hypothetical protein
LEAQPAQLDRLVSFKICSRDIAASSFLELDQTTEDTETTEKETAEIYPQIAQMLAD